MENIAIVAKLLGNLFYFPLEHENNQTLLFALKRSEGIEYSPFSAFISAIEKTSQQSLQADFQLLFEGCEIMPAPPWGSVYLDREKVIFGDSTLRLRLFLSCHNMLLDTGMREPEDQFGLMLMALANIIEQTNDQAIVGDFLAEHLLPWAFHYLELVKKHGRTEVYRTLAVFTDSWLKDLQAEIAVISHGYRLYL